MNLLRSQHLFGLALLALTVQSASAQPAQWAVLIGVQKHKDDRLDLGCTTSDVAKLRQVLLERGGMPAANMLVMTDDSPAAKQPTLDNLRREVPKFLARVGKEDCVIVFYAGHGFLRGDKTYLVPKDTDTAKLDTTALPAAELNAALENAPGKLKFLILDCCHAGGARDEPIKSEVAAETLVKAMEPKNGVVILASCKGKESSWEWAERRQGVFSFWLCEALQGAADVNGDGILDVDEIYKFTHDRVSRTADKLFHHAQTPVRVIGADVSGVSPVLSLLPEPPDSLLRRLAAEIDLELRCLKIKKIGVLEFVTTLGQTEKLGQSNLPKYCATQMRQLLVDLGEGAYQVVDDAKLGPASRGMTWDDAKQPAAVKKLGANVGGMEAVLTGTLRRLGTNLQVHCDLIRTEDGKSLAGPGGALPLSEDLLGDLGYSFENRKRPVGPPTKVAVVDNALERLVLGNPLTKKDFPFKIEVVVVAARRGEKITKQTPREPRGLLEVTGKSGDPDVPRELVLSVKKDEIVELKVTNNFADRVAMNLYVDGLNTIGQRRELIGKGSAWVMDPGKTYTIPGWFLPETSTLKRFQFVDLPQSVAGRKNFGDSIGRITAAFYAPAGRAIGVGNGPEERRTFKTVDDFVPGRLLGIVNIRYVDEKSLP
jgi:Caspase domain